MTISGVYFIKNNINGKVYVGSSSNIYRRWTTHKRELSHKKHHSVKLQNSFNKYGCDAFSYLLAESSKCIKDMALKEAKWIKFFDSVQNGYNINPFPYQVGLMPKSEQHKKRIGEAHIGRKLSEESKERIRQTRLGKKDGSMNEDRKKKISEAKMGKKPMTEEGRKRLSEYRKSTAGIKRGPYKKTQIPEMSFLVG